MNATAAEMIEIRMVLNALEVLDVHAADDTCGVTVQEIKAAYRAAIFANHPDRGGSPCVAVQINAAMSTLRTVLGFT